MIGSAHCSVRVLLAGQEGASFFACLTLPKRLREGAVAETLDAYAIASASAHGGTSFPKAQQADFFFHQEKIKIRRKT
jgi:hypothetical protein